MAPTNPSKTANPQVAKKYIHIHPYKNTGRWGAWVREPKRGGKRVFLGTHLTKRLAARCQDRALLKLEAEPSMTMPITDKINFNRNDYLEDEELRNGMTRSEFFEQLAGESRARYKKFRPSACFKKIWAEEQALGYIPSSLNVGGTPNSKLKSTDEEFDEEYNEEEQPEVDEDVFLEDDSRLEDGSEVKATDLQDAANDTAIAPYISVEPLASLAPVAPAWVGRRRRSGMASDDEMDVAHLLLNLRNGDFGSVMVSDDEINAAHLLLNLRNGEIGSGRASDDVLKAADILLMKRS